MTTALSPTMTPSEYMAALHEVGRRGRTLLFELGDLLLYGEARWGEEAAQYADAAGYAPHTLANAMWVASAIPPERRQAGLSWNHHAAIAGLQPDQQDAALSYATAAKDAGQPLTVGALRDFARSLNGKALQPHRSIFVVMDAIVEAGRAYVRGVQHAERTPGSDLPDPRDFLAVLEEWRLRRKT